MRSWIAALLLLWATVAQAADWTLVRSTKDTTGTGTSKTLTLSAAVTSGDVLLCAIIAGTTPTTDGGISFSIADNQVNAYRQVNNAFDGGTLGAFTNAGHSIATFRSLHPITNAPTSVTFTLSVSAPTEIWTICDEFAPPTGATDISYAGETYTVADGGLNLPNMQVTQNDSLVWSVCFSSGTCTTGAGFTAGIGSGTAQMSQFKIQATPSNAVTSGFATQTLTMWSPTVAIAPIAANSWEPIQHRQQRTGSGTTGAVSLPQVATVGDILVGTIAASDGTFANLTSLKDNLNNNYTLIPGTTTVTGTQARALFWSGGMLTTTPLTITATYSTSQTVNFVTVDEVKPPPNTVSVSLDTASGVSGNDNSAVLTSITSPNLTTTKNNDYAFAMCDLSGANTVPANGFAAMLGEQLTWMTSSFIQAIPGLLNVQCNHTAGGGGNSVALAAFSSTGVATATSSGGVSMGAVMGLRGAGGIGAR